MAMKSKATSQEKSQQDKGRLSRSRQQDLFPKEKAAYGGTLRTTREGRQGSRKISTQHTMHLVLRSMKAKGEWSFLKAENKAKIKATLKKHAQANSIHIISLANVGNHLHIHFKLASRHTYKKFIRSVTGAIALKIMKARPGQAKVLTHKDRFWDYRPFTTIVTSFRHLLNMRDYMRINQFEGLGWHRTNVRLLIARELDFALKKHGASG